MIGVAAGQGPNLEVADLAVRLPSGAPIARMPALSVKPGERAFLVRGDLDPPPRVQERRGDDGPFGWVTGRF